MLAHPVLRDSNTDPAAQAETGPVTLTLGPPTSGPQQAVTVTVDPTWMNSSSRVFPVYVDLSLTTALTAGESGQFGTVNSCTPTLPAPLTRMAVGAESGCTYHGLATFDVTDLDADSRVLTATLNLYTPNQSGQTGVQVYANAPWLGAASWQPPTWSSAPLLMTGTTGLAQSASNGNWQSWNVTGLVQEWVHDPTTNNGITLVGTSTPVLFATPLWAGGTTSGGDSPTLAPYLTITYAPLTTPSPDINDRSRYLYGVSGSFAPDTCSSDFACDFATRVDTVAVPATASPISGIGGAYIRIAPHLECTLTSGDPDIKWWDAITTTMLNYSSGGLVPTYDLIQDAFSDGIIPIVDFLPPIQPGTNTMPPTPCANDPVSDWQNEIQSFISYMTPESLQTCPNKYCFIYFEIGNEENTSPDNGLFEGEYSSVYAAVASVLANNLGAEGYSNYRILTGGVANPSAGGITSSGTTLCSNGSDITSTLTAINAAKSLGVAAGLLGVAVHPYGYDTQGSSTTSGYWRNYYHITGQAHSYGGACYDLVKMITRWVSTFHSMPVIATEINYKDATPTHPGQVASESAYLADLFTIIKDHYNYSVSLSPSRVLWFQGTDAGGLALGIYAGGTGGGLVKPTSLPHCSATGTGSIDFQFIYSDLRNAACY